jgi:hypothetical protein
MKNAILWDMMPCGSCKSLTTATWCRIPEDGILHSHHSENLRFDIVIVMFKVHDISFSDMHLMQRIDEKYSMFKNTQSTK